MAVNSAAIAGVKARSNSSCAISMRTISAMMPYSKLSKPQGTNRIFPALDHVKCLARDRTPVLDTRRKARGCRLVPNAKSGLPRQFANLLLRKSGLQQRSCNTMLLRRLLPRTKVALIVEVHTVCDRIKSARGAQTFHHIKQLILAVKAALSIVPHVLGALEFRSRHHLHRNPLLVRECQSVRKVRACQAGRVSNHRQHVTAQNFMGGPGKISRIDPTRVGNQHAS